MAWDALLKKTGATLDLIPESAMYHMIESAMRGRGCMICQRYAKANNELVWAYNHEQRKSYIRNWNGNNLSSIKSSQSHSPQPVPPRNMTIA